MAKQVGAFKAHGNIGDFTFFKSRDGEMVRMKGGVDGNRIKKDPAFARTRENGQEFGIAAKRGQLLRGALRGSIIKAKDRRSSNRLHQRLMRVLQMDTVNKRGERDVILGDLGLLVGFEFNEGAPLNQTMYFQITSELDRVSGEVTIHLPEYIPKTAIVQAEGATHYKIIAAACELNWLEKSYLSDSTATSWIPIDNAVQAASSLTVSLTPNSQEAIVVVVGLEFGQEVNGDVYNLMNGVFNTLSIVLADKV